VARSSAAGEPEVYSITGAQTPHSRDLDQRVNRYLISMAIRTACVVLVLVVQGPLRWVFAVGAIVLPYVAVILANNVGERRQGPTVQVGDLRRKPRSITAEPPAEPLEGAVWSGATRVPPQGRSARAQGASPEPPAPPPTANGAQPPAA
jgi:hypothetical protein